MDFSDVDSGSSEVGSEVSEVETNDNDFGDGDGVNEFDETYNEMNSGEEALEYSGESEEMDSSDFDENESDETTDEMVDSELSDFDETSETNEVSESPETVTSDEAMNQSDMTTDESVDSALSDFDDDSDISEETSMGENETTDVVEEPESDYDAPNDESNYDTSDVNEEAGVDEVNGNDAENTENPSSMENDEGIETADPSDETADVEMDGTEVTDVNNESSDGTEDGSEAYPEQNDVTDEYNEQDIDETAEETDESNNDLSDGENSGDVAESNENASDNVTEGSEEPVDESETESVTDENAENGEGVTDSDVAETNDAEEPIDETSKAETDGTEGAANNETAEGKDAATDETAEGKDAVADDVAAETGKPADETSETETDGAEGAAGDETGENADGILKDNATETGLDSSDDGSDNMRDENQYNEEAVTENDNTQNEKVENTPQDAENPNQIDNENDAKDSTDQGDDSEKTAIFENASYHQGQNDFGALGTCGPTSIANSLNRVTGTSDYSENEVLHNAMDNNLCHKSDNPYSCGGTTTKDVVNIIDNVKNPESNIHTEVYEYENALDVDTLADRLDDPNTVAMVGVDSATLWDRRGDVSNSGLFQGASEAPSDHWITVDSPIRDENGTVTGFNVIDSGGGVDYVDRDKFESMYQGDDNHRVSDPTAILISNDGESINSFSSSDGVERTENYKGSAVESDDDNPSSGLFSNEVSNEDIISTRIDENVQDIEKVTLPESVASTFKDGEYRTVVTTEPVTLYRTFGGDASVGGAFATTETSVSEEMSRQKTALLPEWNNTCEYEATIVIPPGETLNIGMAEEQYDSHTGKKYEGGGDQILMPQDWYKNHPDWVTDVRNLK